MSSDTVSGFAPLTNAIGLHARPAVKLTSLAKAYASTVELASSPEGPWFDAKSPVRVMRLKAPKGTVLHFRASGADARQAVDALLALVRGNFGEAGPEVGALPVQNSPDNV
jgi:phosphocarrier protein